MKLSSTAIKELSSQYRSVLKKCFILNAAILMGTLFAYPVMAEVTYPIETGVTVNVSEDIQISTPVLAGGTINLSPNSNITITTDVANIQTAGGVVDNQKTAIQAGTINGNGANLTISSTGTGIATALSKSKISITDLNDFTLNSSKYGIYSWEPHIDIDISAKQVNITSEAKSGIMMGTNSGEMHTNISGFNTAIISGNEHAIRIHGSEGSQPKPKYLSVIGNENSSVSLLGKNGSAIHLFTPIPEDTVTISAGNIDIKGGGFVDGTETHKNAIDISNGILNLEATKSIIVTKNEVADNAIGMTNGILNVTASKITLNGGISNVAYDGSGSVISDTGKAVINLSGYMDVHNGTVSKFTGTFNQIKGKTVLTKENGFFSGDVNIKSGILQYGKIDASDVSGTALALGTELSLKDTQSIVIGQTERDVLDNSVIFGEGTSLTAVLNSSTILAKSVVFEGNNSINLILVDKPTAAYYDFITATTVEGTDKVSFSNNLLYNFSLTDAGQIAVAAKTAQEIVKDSGFKEETANGLVALETLDNKIAGQLLEKIQLAGSNAQKIADMVLKSVSPTETAMVASVTTSINNKLMGIADNRMSAGTKGRSAGDCVLTLKEQGMWVKGLYNKTKQDGQFHGYTQGIAMGLDTLINDVFTIGLGYSYNKTDVKANGRTTDVYGHNVFAYGEYQPSAWFVNGAINYGLANYKEQANAVGISIDSKYDVDTFGANLMTGYDCQCGLTPELGLRYLHTKQETYKNTAGVITETKDSDILTAVTGVRYTKDFSTKAVSFTPEVRLAATYDVVSDGTEANVVLGSSSYSVEGKRLPRFAVEAGLGLQMRVLDNVDVNLDYDLSVRRDYTSHTGTLSLKYNF